MSTHAPELTCRQLVELVTDYLEDALPAPERVRFEAHLAGCPGCDGYLAQMRTTLEVVGATARLEARPEASALLQAFRHWKREGSPDAFDPRRPVRR